MTCAAVTRVFILLTLIFGGGDYPAPTWHDELTWAAFEGDLPKVKWLWATPEADVNSIGRRNRAYASTALASATQGNQVAVARWLLQRGADPNAARGKGPAPLLLAARSNNVEVARLLVCAGADVNAASGRDHDTPLAAAARYGQTEVIKLLIDAGANRNAPDGHGDMPYLVAYREAHSEASDTLIWYRPFLTPSTVRERAVRSRPSLRPQARAALGCERGAMIQE